MKKEIITLLALTALSLSACGNADSSELSAKPALSNQTETQKNEESSAVQTAETETKSVEPIEVQYDSVYEQLPEDYDPETYHADENFDRSWTIDDSEKLEELNSLIAAFEESHTAEAEPLGYEVPSERYKFTLGGKEIKLNFYDATLVIIGDKYYPDASVKDYNDIVSLISENPDSILVKTGDMKNNSSWRIDDKDSVKEITDTVAKIQAEAQTCRGGLAAGGHAPNLIYRLNGDDYYVQLRPGDENGNIYVSINRNNDTTYNADPETVEQLYDLVKSFEG